MEMSSSDTQVPTGGSVAQAGKGDGGATTTAKSGTGVVQDRTTATAVTQGQAGAGTGPEAGPSTMPEEEAPAETMSLEEARRIVMQKKPCVKPVGSWADHCQGLVHRIVTVANTSKLFLVLEVDPKRTLNSEIDQVCFRVQLVCVRAQ